MPQTTTNNQNQHGLFAIFKGESGEGKSVAALSFPNAYVFDFDFKMPSIAQKHFPEKEIHWDVFPDVFEVAKQIEVFHGHCPYETLIADSFTGLVNLTMHSAGKVKGESVPDLLSRFTMKDGKKTIEMLGIDYYNAEDRFCTYFIDQLKSLWARPGNPRHVIVTAHVVTVDSAPDLRTKIVTTTRSIVSKGRKTAAWLPTGFDNVYVFGRQMPGLTDIDQSVKRVVKTEAFGEDSAKCSFPFPETIEFTNKSFYDELCKYVDLSARTRIGTEILDAEIMEEKL